MNKTNGCPILRTRYEAKNNKNWWPHRLNLSILQNHDSCNPMDKHFNYIEKFKSLDLRALKKDIFQLMVTSQEWWPADYGHYGPFFIRMAWHSAGTYRIADGRGGTSSGIQRFAPTNSWPDNVNLDKARRLLWPVKQKYGSSISWADLLILTGNCALESMGLKPIGFSGGRVDVWSPTEDTYWGKESKWLTDERHANDGELEKPLAAVQMGLIYVNPEGPNGVPDPLASAKDIRETFKRMSMNDEETVALIVGGHTFGKCHGAARDHHLGKEPEAANIEEQGLGWKNKYKSGKGMNTISSGLEGAWTNNPTQWDTGYLDALFGNEWETVKSPAGSWQWSPKKQTSENYSPAVDGSDKKTTIMMTTADIALRADSSYEKIARYFHKNHTELTKIYANAWFKLTHRDMGPSIRYIGNEVPNERFIWQDSIPCLNHPLIDKEDIKQLKKQILALDICISQWISVAWASASTYRNSDKRGGANGARIRLAPQKDWEINHPKTLATCLECLAKIQHQFNKQRADKKQVSLADLIVLAGCAGVEKAVQATGLSIQVPFRAGRMDASQEQTDTTSFEALQPLSDGFRNYLKPQYSIPAETLLLDQAQLLTLTAPEMTVLVGGLRVLGANCNGSKQGVFTDKKNILTNDFFVNLLTEQTIWTKKQNTQQEFEGRNRKDGALKWSATRVDLIFGSNAQLRAISEVYASQDSHEKFVSDFIAAWVKVMELDRFDLDENYR